MVETVVGKLNSYIESIDFVPLERSILKNKFVYFLVSSFKVQAWNI